MDGPFDGNPEWSVRRPLRDGTTVLIRPIGPADRAGLVHGFHEASAQTRYLRFGMPTAALSEAALTYLTNVDQQDHVALVAIVESPDMKTERGVGVARFVRLAKEPTVAEAAVAVIDDMQNKGVGQALTTELGRAAQHRGIATLRAEVLAENATMHAILARVGAKPVPDDARGEPDGTLRYELALPRMPTTRRP